MDGRKNYRGIGSTLKNILLKKGATPVELKQINSAESFYGAIAKAKRNNLHGTFVTQYKVSDYQHNKQSYILWRNKKTLRCSAFFVCLWATKKIFSAFLRMNSNSCINYGESRVYHPQLVAVYHQCEALYIIKPQAKCTLARDEIQPRRG